MKEVLSAGLCLVLVTVCSAADIVEPLEQEPVITDRGDGSRALAVHKIPVYAPGLFGDEPEQITAETDPPLPPFSMRLTCTECHIYEHDYDVIKTGWHFNATDPNVPPGRPGEPWIYVDAALGVQIPLSYRPWPGAFRPSQIGMSAFQFTEMFGRQMPGGGPGEIETEVFEEIPRQMVSGMLEINCLSCHDRHPAHDQAAYAEQVAKQNFRWAATASAPFADVTGSAEDMPETFDFTMPDMVTNPDLIPKVPTVFYDENAFDHKDNVFFDVSGDVPAERCYFCHSDINVDVHGLQQWEADQDVHMTSGMTCVDCHREGLEHNTIRGYEGEPTDNVLHPLTTCAGCHIGDENGERPLGGRLGAPVPEHLGIPAVHFERLTCTACHSGPYPADDTFNVKTSRAHALGTHGVNKNPYVLPHIEYPVFAKEAWQGPVEAATDLRGAKIAPQRALWPSYWGTVNEEGDVLPIELTVAAEAIGPVVADVNIPRVGDWPEMTEEHVARGLNALTEAGQANPVYVTGGMLYRLGEDGAVVSESDNPAAAAYLWPIAHNVRPAAQSLGVDSCTVCHSTKAPFFFGDVAVDSPVVALRTETVPQYSFQKAVHSQTWAFAMSFIFRPWFKVVAIGSTAVIAIVLLLYALKALGAVARVLAEQD